MSESRGPKPDEGEAVRPVMRDSLVAAAFELFLDRGFEQTTIDDIVARAGVGRRSFFRYFPSKEAVVFPDHDRGLADMSAFLQQDDPGGDPVARACDAARLVVRIYADNPGFSVQRYLLTQAFPGLRTYELSVVRQYERILADFLRARFDGRPDGTLRADVVAAAVVAAHNHALRSWLRSRAEGEVTAAVDEALDYVRAAWSEDPASRAAGSGEAEDVVVVVSRGRAPMWRIVQGVEAALGEI
jgi:AcrR family transcriptional regulator